MNRKEKRQFSRNRKTIDSNGIFISKKERMAKADRKAKNIEKEKESRFWARIKEQANENKDQCRDE